MSWTYDANGDRLSETNSGAVSTYAYPSTANALSSITLGGAARSFAYDAAGNVLTDSRSGALGMTFQYDPEGRLASAVQPATGNGGAYAYNAFGLLSSRTVNQTGSPTTTTLYVYDLKGHVIAETDTSGVTRREYIWMDDLPVAVVSGVNSANPTLYFVHADHLGRPARMTDQNQNWVWDVIYSPFGATSYIWTNPATLDLRFPGQWFQLESGLAYNWHRHYDPTIGRYLQPDPLGLTALLSDGPSVYNYVGGNPLSRVDPYGLAFCTYSISSHTLTCAPNAGGDPATLGPNGVWSGVGPCANDPGCASHNEIGPIVPGNYNMNQDDRPGHEGFWRLEPNPKIPGWKCRLGIERCGFELHPGGISLGCITADKKNHDAMKQYQNVNELLNRENGNNRLRVVP